MRVLAITRILLPKANIPATTALGTVLNNLRPKAFDCKANVVTLDVTPKLYKSFLLSIYKLAKMKS
ncbi:MAG: hypothetical protein H0Z16_06400 [Thermodesulfobacterium sp.]|nr:hypothetical protein [Thermodesulfobacterium sp.]